MPQFLADRARETAAALKTAAEKKANESIFGSPSFSFDPRPLNMPEYEGNAVNISVALGKNFTSLPITLGGKIGLYGNITDKKNKSDRTESTYGFLYSDDTLANLTASNSRYIMDYHTEKLVPYTKKTNYLGIPYGLPDNFSLSGESLGGSFRLYSKYAGHFRPNYLYSETDIKQFSAEGAIGPLNFGVGLTYGTGEHTVKAGKWVTSLGAYKFGGDTANYPADESFFFRFAGDKGGYIDMGDPFSPYRAGITGGGSKGEKSFAVNIPPTLPALINEGSRSARSTFIDYHTFQQMGKATASNFKYNRYTYEENTGEDELELANRIGEFAVFDPNGNRYLYGLPVYSRKEANLNYGTNNESIISHSDYLVYWNNNGHPNDSDTKVGEKRKNPYASMYLLTGITTPAYVDLTADGISADDLGGWTKFEYILLHGGEVNNGGKVNSNSNDWYKWRTPYTGLYYQQMDQANLIDDMASVSYGEKEIYYLEQIETKSHKAIFYTSERLDGLDADMSQAHANENARGDKALNRLDSIVLFSKGVAGTLDKKIRKVCFQYDYSLMQGVPNSDDGTGSTSGKLTLRKVWFEDYEVVEAKIEPYEFSYQYKAAGDYAPEVAARYPDIVNYASQLNANEQNPDYNKLNVDRWGAYQYQGSIQHTKRNPWVNQTPDLSSFDPAAWHLKQITLPSRGQILVQYEQGDYSYVQDRNAMAMVSLKNSSVDNSEQPRYYLNVSDIGVDEQDPSQMAALRLLIEQQFTAEKVYFKMLYLLKNKVNEAGLNNDFSEYIKGYAAVEQVGIDGNGLWIDIVDGGHSTPKEVCQDLVKKERANNVPINPSVLDIDNDAQEKVLELFEEFASIFFVPSQTCSDVDWTNSYFRVPALHPKKGGAVRVKRLLRYDEGLEAGDANLYGTEYLYHTREGDRLISNGVASNEPAEGREENAIVKLQPEARQGKFKYKAIAGDDLMQLEGPIGESVYPGAAVGYSKVTSKNIYDGITNGGFQVEEFFTYKDKPIESNHTAVLQKSDIDRTTLVLYNSSIHNLWASQGYNTNIYNINGNPRTTATYSGVYNDTASFPVAARTEFEYYIGEQIPTYNQGIFSTEPLGRETEIVFESRKMEEHSSNTVATGDVSIGWFGFFPIPFVTGVPIVSKSEAELRTHVTNKVTRHPAFLKRKTTTVSGITQTTENIAFDPATGDPVITKTYDGFHALNLEQSPNHKGNYNQYEFRATDTYPGLGAKWQNESKYIELDPACLLPIKLNNPPDQPLMTIISLSPDCNICDLMTQLSPGDLIQLNDIDNNFWHVGEQFENSILLHPHELYESDPLNQQGLVTSIRVIKSGYTNQLAANKASLTTYGQSGYDPTVIPSPFTQRQALVNTLNLNIAAQNELFTIDLSQAPYAGMNYFYAENNSGVADFCKPGGGQSPSTDGYLGFNFTPDHEGVVATIQPPIADLNGWVQGLALNPNAKSIHYYNRDATNASSYGRFELAANGNIVFYASNGDPCYPQLVKSLMKCDSAYAYQQWDGVVASSAGTLDDEWDYDLDAYGLGNLSDHNDYMLGKKGNWRTKQTLAYNTDLTSNLDGNPSARNYNTGIYADFLMFNWEEGLANDNTNWKMMEQATAYSPGGNLLETYDNMGIYSSRKFGYNDNLPYIEASNARENNIQFESFENTYAIGGNTFYENGLQTNNVPGFATEDASHTGERSLQLYNSIGALDFPLGPVILNDHIFSEGLLFSMWVKQLPVTESIGGFAPDAYLDLNSLFEASLYVNGNLLTMSDFEVVVKTGEWTLLERRIDPIPLGGLSLGDSLMPKIIRKHLFLGMDYLFFVDDVKIVPFDAEATCYVYDKETFQPTAILGSNHMAMKYQYSKNGELVRTTKETAKGWMTVEEGHRILPRQIR